MGVFKKIKKNNGERFAKTIRNYHNGIFEIPNVVDIVKHAGRGQEDAESILPYLMTLLTEDAQEAAEAVCPFKLLDEAGYDAYHADTLKKQNAIKKYFKKDEELCTFRDSSRFKNYFMINCVKKNVDEIKREDFVGKEKREDEYGTSVISIQIAKRGGFISIKNRYNHKVPNCDNTFGSNPDNIIQGLSAALQAYFNVSFSSTSKVPDGFVLVGRRVVKVNYEIDGVFFGDYCYVENGELVEMGEHEYLFDYMIFDAQKKVFRHVVTNDCNEDFVRAFNGAYGGSKTVHVTKHCIYDGETLLVGV